MQITGVPYGGGYPPQFAGAPMGMVGPYGPQPVYMMAAPPPPGGYVQPPFSTSPGGQGMIPMMTMGMMGPGAMPPQPGPPFGGPGGPPMPPVPPHHMPHGSPAPPGGAMLPPKAGEVHTPSKALKILDKEHKEIDLHAPAAPAPAPPTGRYAHCFVA